MCVKVMQPQKFNRFILIKSSAGLFGAERDFLNMTLRGFGCRKTDGTASTKHYSCHIKMRIYRQEIQITISFNIYSNHLERFAKYLTISYICKTCW